MKNAIYVFLLLLLVTAGTLASSCIEDQICITKQRCDEADDSGKGQLGPRSSNRVCGDGLVCCDKAQLESYEASMASRLAKQLPGKSFNIDPKSGYKICAAISLCVPRHLCRSGMVNEDGRFILNPRILNASIDSCSTFENCCPTADQLNETDNPVPRDLKEFRYKGCGYSNPTGLYYALVGYNDNEARYAEFPWMVALMDTHSNYVCGATLIHPQLVLTTAHNVANHSSSSLLARAGEYDMNSEQEPFATQTRNIHSLWPHEQFNFLNHQNDIALLVLEHPFELAPHVQPLCLPPAENSVRQQDLQRAKCFATGWGHRNFSTSSLEHILKRIDLPIIDHPTCQSLLRKTVLGRRFRLHSSFLCAGGVAGKDTCKGDGGSPLFCSIPGQDDRYQLAGIVSWGLQCAEKDIPAAYTNVPYLRSWIVDKVARSGLMIDELK